MAGLSILQMGRLDMDLALSAAKVSLDFKLPVADSSMLAAAQMHNATLWTQDVDFEGIRGVKYTAKQ